MNIELFDEYIAQVFADLYQSFPVPIFVDARKLSGHNDINEFGAIVDQNGYPSKKFEIAKSTIDWLESAGYITSKQSHQWGHLGVTLTAKGLQALNAVPGSLQTKERAGERLVRFVREGAVAFARETAKAIINTGLDMAMK